MNIITRLIADVEPGVIVNKVRLFLSSIVLTALALSASLQAGISPLAFNGVFKCFKPGYEMYAPNLGCAALQTEIVNNIRFCMVNPGKKDADGNRLWIKDKAPVADPVAALAILLFPSPAGSLTAVTSHPQNIGRDLTVEHVAQLLNFCAQVRAAVPHMGGNRFGKNAHKCIERLIAAANKNLKPHTENYFTKFFETEVYSLNTASMNILRSLLKHTHQGRELLVALCKVIELEERTSLNQQFYPKFQAEQLLNAFFCLKFGHEDIPTLLAHLDDSIVDHEMLPEARLIDASDIELINQKQIDNITLDDLWVLHNRNLVDQVIPYARGSKPVNNGLALAYNRQADQLTREEFPDCTETFIRHLGNLTLYSKHRGSFDLTHAKKQLENSPLWKNLEDFYRIQTPDKANSGEQAVRDSFCKVVGGLGHRIRYRRQSETSAPRNDAEVDSGIFNIIRVLNIMYNLELDAEPIYTNDQQFADDITQWAQASLEKMFKLLDPHKQVDIDIANVVTFRAFGDYEHDCQGIIKIKVNNDFTCTMSIESNHTQFDLIDILVPEQQMMGPKCLENVVEKFKPAFQNSILQSLFLLDEQTRQATQYQLYGLFQNGTGDSMHIIEILDRLLVMTQENKISLTRAAIILRNCLQMFLWQDTTMMQKIQPSIKNWKDFVQQHSSALLINIIQEETKAVRYDLFKDDFNDNADQLLNFFHNASKLYCHKQDYFSFSLMENHPELEVIDFMNSGITDLEISGNCPHLDTITLSLSKELEAVQLSGNLDKLTTLNLSQTGIIKLNVEGNYPFLKIIDLARTKDLKSIKISGIAENLKKIDLSHSNIELLEIESSQCPNLEALNLKFTNKLKSAKLLGIFKMLKKLNLACSNLTELKIAGSCPNLGVLDTKIKFTSP